MTILSSIFLDLEKFYRFSVFSRKMEPISKPQNFLNFFLPVFFETYWTKFKKLNEENFYPKFVTRSVEVQKLPNEPKKSNFAGQNLPQGMRKMFCSQCFIGKLTQIYKFFSINFSVFLSSRTMTGSVIPKAPFLSQLRQNLSPVKTQVACKISWPQVHCSFFTIDNSNKNNTFQF